MPKFIPLVSVLLLLTCTGLAHSHETCCDHSHPTGEMAKENSLCEPQDAACYDEPDCVTGTCKYTVTSVRQYCVCAEADSDDDCSASGNETFEPINGSLPAPGLVETYVITNDPTSGWSVANFQGDFVDFEPIDNAVEGTITLQYGDFLDPTNIPVLLTDVDLTVIQVVFGAPSPGTGNVHLPSPLPIDLVYDSTSGIIAPIGSAGIPLTIDYPLGVTQSAVFWFEAEVQPDGSLKMYGTGVSYGAQSVASSSWVALVGLAVLLLLVGGVVARRPRWRLSVG